MCVGERGERAVRGEGACCELRCVTIMVDGTSVAVEVERGENAEWRSLRGKVKMNGVS